MRGIGLSLALVALFVLLTWVFSNAVGWHMALFGSLVLSLGLTLILNLILGAFGGGSRRRPA